MIKNCHMRHENGNCLPAGSFCTANKNICEALHNAYELGRQSIQPEQKWIPCSEKLPRDSSEKIVTFTSGYVSTASFVLREKIYCNRMLVSTRENFWQVIEEDEEEGEVVAWMPLPEPYKGGTGWE